MIVLSCLRFYVFLGPKSDFYGLLPSVTRFNLMWKLIARKLVKMMIRCGIFYLAAKSQFHEFCEQFQAHWFESRCCRDLAENLVAFMGLYYTT